MGLRAFDGIGSSKGVMVHFWFFDFFCFSPCRDPKKAILSPPIQIFRMSSSRRFQWCMTCPKFHTGWPFFGIFCFNGKISVKTRQLYVFGQNQLWCNLGGDLGSYFWVFGTQMLSQKKFHRFWEWWGRKCQHVYWTASY